MAPELQTSPTTVAQLMSRRPILVWPDTAVSEVAELLDRHGITAVPVVDWTGYLVMETAPLPRSRRHRARLASLGRSSGVRSS